MNRIIRTFHLERKEDESGVSGVGEVAFGCQFTDTGECVLHWIGSHSCTNIYHNISDVNFLHGHNGKTKVVFDELEENKVTDKNEVKN